MRTSWDDWFMTLCAVIAQRSLDEHTKHGCVVIDSDRTILSIGYNSPPRGCVDEMIPLTRPEKYAFMEHSESNAIINAARTGTCLKGSTFYITGHPCHECFRKILNVGAKAIVYGPVGSHCIDDESMKAIEIMSRGHVSFEMREYKSWDSIIDTLDVTADYLHKKLDVKE